MEAPQSTAQDRQYLKMEISEYRAFADCLSTQSFIKRDGQICKLKTAKLKKLKNLRYTIKKNEFLMKSLIWREQLRLIEVEISKRRRIRQGDFSR